jgi:hypothetical protein
MFPPCHPYSQQDLDKRGGSASVGTWNYKNAKGVPYSYIEQPEIVVVEVKTYKTGFSRLIA